MSRPAWGILLLISVERVTFVSLEIVFRHRNWTTLMKKPRVDRVLKQFMVEQCCVCDCRRCEQIMDVYISSKVILGFTSIHQSRLNFKDVKMRKAHKAQVNEWHRIRNHKTLSNFYGKSVTSRSLLLQTAVLCTIDPDRHPRFSSIPWDVP